MADAGGSGSVVGMTHTSLHRRALLTAAGGTVGQGALRWLLSISDRTLPVPGIRTVAQAEENAAAMRLPLFTADELAEIEAALG